MSDQAEAGIGPLVVDPGKLVRIATMVASLLDEVRDAPPDEDGRRRLARIHNEAVSELSSALSENLVVELDEFNSCCDATEVPSEGEIRVAQAQLMGWLQGVLNGLRVVQAAPAPDPGESTQNAESGHSGTYL